MRVLIDYRPALRKRSGAGEYTHQLIKALVAMSAADPRGRPLELTLFSSSWKDRLVLSPDLAGAAAIDRRVPVRLLNFSWHRLGWPAAETLTGRTYDVTHSSHPLLLPARAAAQVITIHDLNFLTHPERTRREVRRDYAALARDHAHRADRILVPSSFTAGDVERRLGVARERIAICPPGAPDWPPRAAAPKDGYVLFVSTLEPRKNVGGLLDAYELLLSRAAGGPGTAKAVPYDERTVPYDEGAVPHDERAVPYDEGTAPRENAARPHRDESPYVGHRFSGAAAFRGVVRRVPELVLAGNATDDAKPWLERLERPPLKGVVRHLGYVDADQRRALFEGARLLVQPSFEEGFGLSVLDAMTLGVPVVASNRGSLPEVLGDAGRLIDPDRPAEIANAMARVLEDDEYAAACTSKGLARARAFRWDQTARLVYDTYRKAIERRERRTRSA